MLDTFTIICCTIILLAFIAAYAYINSTADNTLPKKRQWIEQLPSFISTLGVLGTFAGITKGLMNFDTGDLDHSIPLLLDGMKTAFFTSLLGMIGSLVLNRKVSHKFDISKQPSDTEVAADKIVSAIESNHKMFWQMSQRLNSLPDYIKEGNEDMVGKLVSDDTVKAIHNDLQQIKDDVEIIKGKQEEIEGVLNNIKSVCEEDSAERPRIRAVVMTATESISSMDNNISEVKDKIDKIAETTDDIKENQEDSEE